MFTFDTTYSSLPSVFYKLQKPTPVRGATLAVVNEALAAELGLHLADWPQATQADMFAGNLLPEGATPFAQAYAGHQFGRFTMLGDGRAIMLGEHITPAGTRVDVHLKGAGRTPYSRNGDGRAALGPMLREYIISEAMHALGIPTTRSLAVVTTGEKVQRQTMLPGAVLTRIAASHIRVGTFEFAAMQNNAHALQSLVDYTIKRHFPACAEAQNPALALFSAVASAQATLLVHWMRVGFIHGVMNTDNMALSGETIDYGPCAFMDAYSNNTVFSSIDDGGRYAYGNQPFIAAWNLACFANALLPCFHPEHEEAVHMAEEALEAFHTTYAQGWLAMMRGKLGLAAPQDDDEQLVADLLACMEQHHADYTNTFRALGAEEFPAGAGHPASAGNSTGAVSGVSPLFASPEFAAWRTRWQARLAANPMGVPQAMQLMQQHNPVYIPRNHLVEAALRSAEEQGDYAPLHNLLGVLAAPYTWRPGLEKYEAGPKSHERVYQTFCGT
ncbi:protein adenylyltransferase SelO [Desulfovibrio cuneatus]|uniref:protein adenylyltransferase SelO n=1 Tax=Desulfovibrio cuneatus TaxID=159728 RepID=UPI00040864ED|nr:YdiU family protein [Desulfovibrio cuneatus]